MNKQKKFIEEASIRLALIQPAYNETYPDASKRAYYCRITEKPIKMPDGREVRYSPGTLACWESDYRRGGFDALIPKTGAMLVKAEGLMMMQLLLFTVPERNCQGLMQRKSISS